MKLISLAKLTVIAAVSVLAGVNAACDYSVLVIGAGPAGMGAAKELKSQGCNVTVLEARNRTGGRINTENMGTTKVDMGASWIHGIGPGLGDDPSYKGKMNPIYTIAQDNKISTVQTWADQDVVEDKIYWYKSPTVAFDQDKLSTMSSKVRSWVKEKKDSATTSQSVEQSLADFNYGTTTDDNLIFKAAVNRLWSQDYAADFTELSAKYYDSNDQFNGPEHIFPDGYIQIINALSQDINIVLNEPVTKIDYSGEDTTVTTFDGSTYTADKVIVTVPVGVLQANKITFTPALASSKTDAIKRLGNGVMEKLWLEFPTAFWTNDLNSDWIAYVSDTPGQWVESLNVYKYTKKPVLLMFNIGQAAKDLQKLTDAQVIASAMAAIKKWYPNAPAHINYKRSSWGNDPYALGSYPFVKAGATPSDCQAYQEEDTTNKKIYFAGDGTTCTMIGTVHGAYITGVKAAQKIAGVHQDSFGLIGQTVQVFATLIMVALVYML